jgi:hypothetical protein
MTSSRNRMLAALNCEESEYPPCSFMLYKGLQITSKHYADYIERQIDIGLDPYVMIPPRQPVVVNDYYNLHGMPVTYSPKVEIKEWVEHPDGEKYDLLVKEYHTPKGILRAEVWKTEDWPWDDHIPFLDDRIASRSNKFIVEEPADLESLHYLLVPPTTAEIKRMQDDSQLILDLARQHDLLVSGGWGVGADMLGWIYGLENMVFASVDFPDFLHAMLELIAEWNQKRMKTLLDLGLDLYIKRAWYETCHFWSPKSFREFIFPILKKEVELTHTAGAKFGYIVTSNTMPLLEMYAEAGVDVLMGVDPMEWDLARTKEVLNGKVCLWGGVNGQLTVERGTEAEVTQEVSKAFELLAPGGGFILSPVDNVRVDDEVSRRNVQVLVEEWRKQANLA